MMALGILAGAALSCSRIKTTVVTLCQGNTRVQSDLSANASVIHSSTLGEVLKADLPPKEPTHYWWLHTPNGRGYVGGTQATRFPMPSEEYEVSVPDAPQFASPDGAGGPLRTLPKGTRVKLSTGGTCAYPAGVVAVVGDGRPVAFMRAEDVSLAGR
jgi:hypothetical protein